MHLRIFQILHIPSILGKNVATKTELSAFSIEITTTKAL
jgi:hypothetical protein